MQDMISKEFVVKGDTYKQTILPALSLFTSMSTLLCCALPALFVTLGMGAALAGLVSTAPWLVAISEYKVMVFIGAGFMLMLAFVMQWRARNKACPVDSAQKKVCMRLRRFSWVILIFSILVYLIGIFFAFIAVKIFY